MEKINFISHQGSKPTNTGDGFILADTTLDINAFIIPENGIDDLSIQFPNNIKSTGEIINNQQKVMLYFKHPVDTLAINEVSSAQPIWDKPDHADTDEVMEWIWNAQDDATLGLPAWIRIR